MLCLNPGDNQGLRYILAGWLLTGGDDRALEDLLAAYPDEDSASWAYTRALAAFRRHGAGPAADQALQRALQSNPHVPLYLLGVVVLPDVGDNSVTVRPPSCTLIIRSGRGGGGSDDAIALPQGAVTLESGGTPPRGTCAGRFSHPSRRQAAVYHRDLDQQKSHLFSAPCLNAGPWMTPRSAPACLYRNANKDASSEAGPGTRLNPTSLRRRTCEPSAQRAAQRHHGSGGVRGPGWSPPR